MADHFSGVSDRGVPAGHFEIKVFADRNALDGTLPDTSIVVSVGDGKFVFIVPPDLDDTNLVVAEAGISAVGSSDLEVTLYNLTQTVDMLTSSIVIPAGDFASFPPAVTAISNGNVFAADRISINVDAAGGGDAEGLMVILQFDV